MILFCFEPLFNDSETRQTVNKPNEVVDSRTEAVHIESRNPLKMVLKWSQPIGQRSHVTQRIHISVIDDYIEFETIIDWRENRKFLKVEFPVNVHAQCVSCFLNIFQDSLKFFIFFWITKSLWGSN